MKKYSKLIIAAIIALIFIGTFVFLWQKSQPKEIGVQGVDARDRQTLRKPPSSPAR